MKKLTRSLSDRQVAGICGGLGEYMNVDSTILRLALVFLGFITAFVPLLITYFIGWAIIPEEEEKNAHVKDPEP